MPAPLCWSSVRIYVIRLIALLCACSLSFGSHFGREFLGPLKSSLIRDIGTTNLQFSAILASYSVNNTWTPLVAGFLASRLGTARSSLLATSLILIGQLVLLWGRNAASIKLMAAGLFVFGLGVSPISVVQETIIVRFFSDHGLGVSLAFGLLAGKGSSFIAAFTSYPLAQSLGPLAPFVVSTLFASFSFIINLIYLFGSRWLANGAGVELEEAEQKADYVLMGGDDALRVATEKKKVILRDMTKLGDVFWTYIAFNFLCGWIWSPYFNIAANLFQVRYEYSEYDAGKIASFLHAGSIILYPIVGFITDRFQGRSTMYRLCLLSSAFTLLGYCWLLLPPHLTLSALPAVCLFTFGQGFATLLLVLIVPKIVPRRHVPTALGAHKSMEQAGATISVTVAGYLLDRRKTSLSPPKTPAPRLNHLPSHHSGVKAPGKLPTPDAVFRVLFWFAMFNIAQFIGIHFLYRLDSRRHGEEPFVSNNEGATSAYEPLSSQDGEDRFVDGDPVGSLGADRLSDSEAEAVGIGNDGLSLNSHRMGRLSTLSSESLLDLDRSGSRRLLNSRSSRDSSRFRGVLDDISLPPQEHSRGKAFFILSGLIIFGAWVFYVVSLVLDFRGY
ncbi:major facilitator superfamily domain-containing protein [Cantharellus anzutake]|uniref:major facilitator superfamily domain-containing protein n=1 Tax=Cantharellus anzutake TaxID=1750568 RepID=UPI0019052B0F|nr:major facilitator superfamily domain-containing protein [Cantharellus anzutake]KAF8335475.1 major facilitator superfamily domain-containing protein [Cantharellus anzutake]